MNRYARHTKLFDVKKLENKTVLIVGLGALGTNVAERLIRAVPVDLILCDFDKVEEENLSSQLYFENQIGKKKASATKSNLLNINSKANIKIVNEKLTKENAKELIKPADIIADCTDNFISRYIINETARKLRKPWIFGSIIRNEGMQANFLPDGPCFECTFPKHPVNECQCSEVGVLNTIVSVIASLQATEILKVLQGKKVSTDLRIFNISEMNFKTIKTRKKNDCRVC